MMEAAAVLAVALFALAAVIAVVLIVACMLFDIDVGELLLTPRFPCASCRHCDGCMLCSACVDGVSGNPEPCYMARGSVTCAMSARRLEDR